MDKTHTGIALFISVAMWPQMRHRINLSEPQDVQLPKVHDVKQNRVPNGGPSSHVRSLSHRRYTGCDTESVHDPTCTTVDSCELSSSSLVPPEDSSTMPYGYGSFHRFGANPTDVALHDTPTELHQSFRGFTIKYHQNETTTRIRSRSPHGARRNPFSPGTINRRDGVIAVPNFDRSLNGHCPVAMGADGADRLDKAVMDRNIRNRPGNMILQTNPNAVHYNQIVRNTFELLPGSPQMTPDQEHDFSPFHHPNHDLKFDSEDDMSSSSQPGPNYQYDAGHSAADSLESSHDEDIATNKNISPIGKWRCCKCLRGHEIYRFEAAQHLISVLNCLCRHRSCKSCTFQGNIRRFAPIYDIEGVALIPVLEGNGKPTRFGVICHTCGLSWCAEKVKEPKRHRFLRKKLSYLPKKINPLRKLRHTQSMINLSLSPGAHSEEARPGSAMSTFRSTFNLTSASDTSAKGTKPEEQVQGAQVRFYGIVCTCGTITNSSSVCFQVIDTSDINTGSVLKEQTTVEATNTAQSQCMQELKSKGYGTSTLYLKGGVHPNPLLSNPVQDCRFGYD